MLYYQMALYTCNIIHHYKIKKKGKKIFTIHENFN